MKFYFFIFITILFLQSCSDKNSQQNNTINSKVAQSGNKTDKDNQPTANPSPKSINKTAVMFYDFLKSKNWNIQNFRPIEMRMFKSEESASFKDAKKFGYLILRYKSAEKAQAMFPTIDELYRMRGGRSFIGNNFIISVYNAISHNRNQYSDKEYQELQSALNEFVTE